MSFEKITRTISSLEKRVQDLEKIVYDKIPQEQPIGETIPEEETDFENFSGASQLGWLGIVIAIACSFFFIHYSFQKNWITGAFQPLTLGSVGLILFVIGDLIRKKEYQKFGTFLVILSSSVLFLAIYWSSNVTATTGPHFLISASFGLCILHLLWSLFRKTSLWSNLGIVGAQIFLLLFVRSVNPVLENQMNSILWMSTTLPAIFILWSGLSALLHNRSPTNPEKFSWAVNNIISYSYIFAFWNKFQKPWLVLVPLSANAFLYFFNWIKNKRQTHEFSYLLGVVTSTAIALTLLMPIPVDIITLCLFAVFLGHFGDNEEGWHLKAVSGGMIIWCLVFLFTKRFHFTVQEETAFINLRFSSFVIAFLCFGYQGLMIHNDLKVKKMGPILGQGLLSLGISVLFLGIAGEIMHVFPCGKNEVISQPALLSLTVLGGIFGFAMAYASMVFKLLFLRILSIVFFLILVLKVLLFDLLRLNLPHLVISLASMALLLGGTSLILKKRYPNT